VRSFKIDTVNRSVRLQMVVAWYLLLIIPVILIGISSNLFLGFCVYYDAKYRRNENAVIWGVLSGLFMLTALVYIIITKVVEKPQQGYWCAQCGERVLPNSAYCSRCGRLLKAPTEYLEAFDKRRKLFFTLWIISIVAVTILVIISVAFIMLNSTGVVYY
jgi:DNA-directed RNA polymerase subunit RPC12/RpoP